jgi:hypothetical protein
MSEPPVTDSVLRRLGGELIALETRAGIIEKVKDAELGPFLPNLDASHEEYFKEVEYHARRKIRQLYFGLLDVAVRKELIAKRRQCDSVEAAYWQREVATARQNLEDKERRVHSLPWGWAGSLAVLCVAIGAYFFQIYGAIGGALMGFFLAQGFLAQQRNTGAVSVRAAQEELDEALKTERENEATLAYFNAGEERTGEMDEEFDLKSIYDPRS